MVLLETKPRPTSWAALAASLGTGDDAEEGSMLRDDLASGLSAVGANRRRGAPNPERLCLIAAMSILGARRSV
jgi:hypothetical protein